MVCLSDKVVRNVRGNPMQMARINQSTPISKGYNIVMNARINGLGLEKNMNSQNWSVVKDCGKKSSK